ncbi:hypothetical protein GCM10018790_10060 [Kitasatospora xanthocidica]|nr:hypothetical protein GCM10018790_10060 [Kitasatospora xanthocidica]
MGSGVAAWAVPVPTATSPAEAASVAQAVSAAWIALRRRMDSPTDVVGQDVGDARTGRGTAAVWGRPCAPGPEVRIGWNSAERNSAERGAGLSGVVGDGAGACGHAEAHRRAWTRAAERMRAAVRSGGGAEQGKAVPQPPVVTPPQCIPVGSTCLCLD